MIRKTKDVFIVIRACWIRDQIRALKVPLILTERFMIIKENYFNVKSAMQSTLELIVVFLFKKSL
jgi:hypothetical protein